VGGCTKEELGDNLHPTSIVIVVMHGENLFWIFIAIWGRYNGKEK
jgi:hypothetical protein